MKRLRLSVQLFLVTGNKKIWRKKKKRRDRRYESAAASDTSIPIWQVQSTQMHNLGAYECKYAQAGWHERTSAIHHPQDADSFPSPPCLLPTPASKLLPSFLREISRKDQFASLFLLVEPLIGLGGDHKGLFAKAAPRKKQRKKTPPRSIRTKQLTRAVSSPETNKGLFYSTSLL